MLEPKAVSRGIELHRLGRGSRRIAGVLGLARFCKVMSCPCKLITFRNPPLAHFVPPCPYVGARFRESS